MDKLRLDFYLSVGGELVECDELIYKNGKEETACSWDVQGWNLKSSNDKDWFITSFTERENKGVQPVSDDFPVVVSQADRGFAGLLAKELHWSLECYHGIISWKPDYEALLKMQAEHDKHNESIIKACNEANKKESEMEFKQHQDVYISGYEDREWKFGCYMLDMKTCIVIDDSAHMTMPTSRLSATPIKTPEEIEQENKIKGIHSKLLQSGFEVELSAVKFLNKNYIITDK